MPFEGIEPAEAAVHERYLQSFAAVETSGCVEGVIGCLGLKLKSVEPALSEEGFSVIRIVSNWLLQLVMKEPGGGSNTFRFCWCSTKSAKFPLWHAQMLRP